VKLQNFKSEKYNLRIAREKEGMATDTTSELQQAEETTAWDKGELCHLLIA